MLRGTQEALARSHDLAMLDLDGVVYVDGEAVPRAADAIAAAREQRMRVAFITNNASRTPSTVSAHLRRLGVDADDADVVTSAQAAARVLVERLGAGARVVLLGAEGLVEAVRAVGLEPVGVEADAAAVVTGYGPDVRWRDVMRAAVRIRDGLWWVASNTDRSIPTAYGVAPGHGVLVETLQRFSGVEPVVAGKPARPLLDETVRRVGGERPLMVGDRLDTDIEGAVSTGIEALLVLTGVTDLSTLLAARAQERPTYLHPDLRGLLEPHPEVIAVEGRAECGGWTAVVEDGRLQVRGEGEGADWWRVAAVAGWAHLDATGDPVESGDLVGPPTAVSR